MRSPVILRKLVKALVSLHFNHDAISRLLDYKPYDPNNLIIDEPVKQWASVVKRKLPGLKTLLHREHKCVEQLRILDELEKTLLFKGYSEFFSSMINRAGKIVLCHNDPQENNILMNIEDNHQLVLIDLEFAGFNPIAYDVGVVLNETGFCNASNRYY